MDEDIIIIIIIFCFSIFFYGFIYILHKRIRKDKERKYKKICLNEIINYNEDNEIYQAKGLEPSFTCETR